MAFILLLLIASWYEKFFVEFVMEGSEMAADYYLEKKNDIRIYKELLKSYINIEIHPDPNVRSGFISEE